MLQQTQVKRVLEEYYFQFLDRFPSLELLSQASVEEVFSLWSGLGYYRRAANLHKTAQLCSPTLPLEYKELLKLPGIGRYTASAICSFAYKHNIAVVDTNIARVLSRLLALQDPKEKELWEKAEQLVHPSDARSYNLALMDLGATVCLAKNPLCEHCPLQELCKAKENIALYTQTQSTNYEQKTLYLGVYITKGLIALSRSKEGMYTGLLTLPHIELRDSGYKGSFKHSVTKYRLTIHLYELDEEPLDIEFFPLENLENAPISSMTKKALDLYFKK